MNKYLVRVVDVEEKASINLLKELVENKFKVKVLEQGAVKGGWSSLYVWKLQNLIGVTFLHIL